MDNAKSLFDQKADAWDEQYHVNVFYRDRNATLRRWLERIGGGLPGRALDIGCGTAQASRIYQEFGMDYVGVDTSPNMVANAKKKRGASALVIDGSNLPFESGSVAVANMFNVIEFVDHPSVLLNEVSRVLRPGGRFLMTITNYRSIVQLGVKMKRRLVGRSCVAPENKNEYDFFRIQTLLESCGFTRTQVFTYGLPEWTSSNEFKWYHALVRNTVLGSSIYLDSTKPV